MRVRDIMRVGAAMCVVSESETTRAVIHKIATTEGRPGAAAVTATDGTLAGIFTDGDLRRLLDEDTKDLLSRPIGEIMSRNPKVTTPDALGTEALLVLANALAHGLTRDEALATVSPTVPVTLAELVFGVTHEGAADVADLLDRRTRVGLVPADRASAEPLARRALAIAKAPTIS